MTIPLMLATSGNSGGGEPVRPPDPRPATTDPVIQAMRPTGRVIFTATVAKDGTGDYTSIEAASTAAKAAQTARMNDEGAIYPTPDYRCDIIVKAGTYTGDAISWPAPWSGFYADGDVLITRDGVGATGVADVQGRVYIEGFDFLKTTPPSVWEPKYAAHNKSTQTTVWADCGFYQDTTDWQADAGARTSGNDAAADSTVIFYKCRFNGRSDSHGWDTNTGPHTVVYVECQSSGLVGFRSGDGGGGLQADHVWVVGGDVAGVNAVGPNLTLHLDPATVHDGVQGEHATQDTNTRWPIPYGALVEQDRAYYGLGTYTGPTPPGTPGY